MNLKSKDQAIENGADLKKLDSIDRRVASLLKDCKKQGIRLSMNESGQLALIHVAEGRHVLLGVYG
jgi:hypothetical protein